MPAGFKITLTLDEDQTLKELELENKVPRRTRNRASILRMNSREWTVKEIAEYLGWAESTVRQTIHRWNKSGLSGLWLRSNKSTKNNYSKNEKRKKSKYNGRLGGEAEI